MEQNKKRVNKNGFSAIAILAVIAGAAVLAAAGFWAYQRYAAIPAPAEKPAEGKTTIPQPVAEKVDTSNWKTYRNEKYGFEVRYPVNFTAFIDIKEKPEGGFEVTPPTQDSKKIYLSERPSHFLCCEPVFVQIGVLDQVVTDFEQWLKDHKFMPPENDFRLKRKGYETFAEERAYRIFSEAGLDSYGNTIILNHEGRSFLIRYNVDTATFASIIDSFEFINNL